MRSLTEKIKNRLAKCTALQKQSFGLWLICFAFMFAIRYKYAWHWDDLAYLKNMIRGLPSDLLLGRPGFMYPFIWLWLIIRKLGGSFYIVEDIVRISGIFFLSAAYVFIFRIFVALNISVRVSFLTVIFFLSEFSFSVISSRVGDSALMYLCVTASYFYFIKAHDRQRLKYLLLSSFLFGYAFLVREPALFYFPFYLILLIYFYRQRRLFPVKNYLTGAGLMLMTAVSVPVVMMLYYGSGYLDTFQFSSTKGYLLEASNLVNKARIVWSDQINGILLPLCLGGLALFFKRHGWLFSTGLALCTLGPVIVTLFFSEEALVMEPRLFLGLFCFIAFGTAYLVDAIATSIVNTRFRRLTLVTAGVVVAFVTASRFLPQYRTDVQRISYLQNYYENIKPLIGKNVVVILGDETLYVAYRGLADGIGPYFISPGWSWPAGKLIEKINFSLSENLTVIYDPKGRFYMESRRAKDLDEMTETFALTETKNGFIQVSPKK